MFLSDFLIRVLFQVSSCVLAASLLQGLLKAEPQVQIRPVRKIKNHSHSQCQGGSMCGLLRASGRAFAVRVIAEKNSAHFSEFPQNFRNLRWRSINDFWKIFRENFRKICRTYRSAVCSALGWSLCAAECVVVLSCSVKIEWLHCLPT